MNPLTHYQAIEQSSQRMVRAAARGQWDEVGRLEAVCEALIAQLRQALQGVVLTVEEQAHKRRIAMNILRCDAQIRVLAESTS